jgi:flagellar motility protein MotE (MotC chaperone)
MIAKLQNPFVAATLGVVLSVGIGIGLAWRVLSANLGKLVIAKPVKDTTELKRQGWDFWTIEIENLSNELRDERLKLRKQAELLDQRAARLAAEEKEFAKVRADVEKLRREISDRITEISADEAKNIRTLATTYATLTPKAAVAIVRELDDPTAVKILSLMKPDIVGPIFEEMGKSGTPDSPLARRAATLSEKIRLMKAAKANPPN